MAGVKELQEFIDYAEKNRKYAAETAKGRRAALRLFEPELNDDEQQSVDLILDRFDKIYQAVHTKNKLKITASSLETYKSRLLSLLKEYKKYGIDPNAFNAWDMTRKHEPKRVTKADGAKKKSSDRILEAEVVDGSVGSFLNALDVQRVIENSSHTTFANEPNRIEFFMRPDFKVSLALPSDMNTREANRLKQMIDGMIVDDQQ